LSGFHEHQAFWPFPRGILVNDRLADDESLLGAYPEFSARLPHLSALMSLVIPAYTDSVSKRVLERADELNALDGQLHLPQILLYNTVRKSMLGSKLLPAKIINQVAQDREITEAKLEKAVIHSCCSDLTDTLKRALKLRERTLLDSWFENGKKMKRDGWQVPAASLAMNLITRTSKMDLTLKGLRDFTARQLERNPASD
jgi:hypothetical protein